MRCFSGDKPKISLDSVRLESLNGWRTCSKCREMIHDKELQEQQHCCPKCHYHYPLTVQERIELLADPGSFTHRHQELRSVDPLSFVDTQSYAKRLEQAYQSSTSEAITVGTCELYGHKIALGVLDFQFMGGSMGSVVGEKITRLIEDAIEEQLPLIIVSSSGGARMQESIFSLMQMAKTAAALDRLHAAKGLYISVLTHPTTGGVTASFASLGDIVFAEPEALICFAGPRVVEQVTKEKIPQGAQKSEFLLEHGMIDDVVSRSNLKKKIGQVLSLLAKKS